MIIGATLGGDVYLRDFEGRNTLLLGHAKDTNGSCAVRLLNRLFDVGFTLDNVRSLNPTLTLDGSESCRLEGTGTMRDINGDPLAGRPQHRFQTKRS